jgi:signal peptidase II
MQAARGASLTVSDPGRGSAVPTHRRRSIAVFGLVAALAYAVDLASKQWAVAHLTGRPPRHVVGTVFQLELVRNPGAAFSTGTSYTVVLSCVAICAALAVLWVARRLGSTGWAIGLGFLLAGVCGNLTDRLFREPGVMRGHVVDFMALPHWPIFNVADMCIDVAAAFIVIQAMRGIHVAGTRRR